MKKVFLLIFTLCALLSNAQIKFAQLEICKDKVTKLPIDSCCTITGANGVLHYLTKQECKALYKSELTIVDSIVYVNGVPLADFCKAVKKCETPITVTNNVNGSYTVTNEKNVAYILGYKLSCLNDSIIRLTDQDGTIVTSCTIKGKTESIDINNIVIQSDSTVLIQFNDGSSSILDICNAVKKCETAVTTINNPDGSYTITNEKNTVTILGYNLNCVNDSTIQIRDYDGTVISTCIIKGGTTNVPLAVQNLVILSDSTIQINFTDGSVAPFDICNVVKKCETKTNIIWDFNSNEYYYNREDGGIDTIGFTIGYNNVTHEIYHINHLGDTTARISSCDLTCVNMASATDDNYSTNNCSVPYCGSVATNDQLCSPQPTVSVVIVGNVQGGSATIDDAGNFCFTFNHCDPNLTNSFVYKITCADGTEATATVDIDLTDECVVNSAVSDMMIAYKNTSTNFNVTMNDLTCTDRTYKISTNPINGNVFFNDDGTGIYNANSGFVGKDSFVVELYCNGQICDTSKMQVFVFENAPMDSTYYLFQGDVLLSNASGNDKPCTPPSVSSYNWLGVLTPSIAGNISGSPTSYTYTVSSTYCGDAFREYEQVCTPPGGAGTKAKEIFKIVCASGVPDFKTVLNDTVGSINVASNDMQCTNGAQTTWHLLQKPNFSGTVAHGSGSDTLNLIKCKGVCPISNPLPSDKIGHIHSWDTLTGVGTFYIPSSYEGSLCFKYFVRCKLPNGTIKNDDTVCVQITREVTPSVAALDITLPNVAVPNFNTKFTGFCGEIGSSTALQNGDILHVNITTTCGQTVDVDLIVGGNIKVASTGYINDIGGKWSTIFVPSITTASPVMTASSLLAGTFSFDTRKDTLSKLSDCWGDGTILSDKIGSNWNWNLNIKSAANCKPSAIVRDTMIKLWDFMSFSSTHGQGGGVAPCPQQRGLSEYLRYGYPTAFNNAFVGTWQPSFFNQENSYCCPTCTYTASSFSSSAGVTGYYCYNPGCSSGASSYVGDSSLLQNGGKFLNITLSGWKWTKHYTSTGASTSPEIYTYTGLFTDISKPTIFYDYWNSNGSVPCTTVNLKTCVGNNPNDAADVGTNRTCITNAWNGTGNPTSLPDFQHDFKEGAYNLYIQTEDGSGVRCLYQNIKSFYFSY